MKKDENSDKISEIQKRIVAKLTPESFPEEMKLDILEWVNFRRELTNESNRGCALLAASHLDYLLEQMIFSKLVGTVKQRKSLFEFNGPLGTFSSRILLSYSIGLISESYVNDLQIIRKIRNEFGHSPNIIDFENEKISSLCNNLKLSLKTNKNNRAKFITSTAFISGSLTGLTFKNENKFVEMKDQDFESIKKDSEEFRTELGKMFEEKTKKK